MNLSKQIKLEKQTSINSANYYYAKQDKLRSKQLGDQLKTSSFVIQRSVLDIAATIETFANKQTKGIGGKYNTLLKKVAARIDKNSNITYDYPAVAFLGLQSLFQAMGTKQGADYNTLEHTIATKLEADHKARLFEAHEPAYFNTVMKSFTTQMIQQYQHKHRVIMLKFNEFDIQWEVWNTQEKLQVANRILIAILQTLPDIFYRHAFKTNNTTKVIIETTPQADEWFAEFEKESGLMHPQLPLIIPPLNWKYDEASGELTGGYFTHRLAMALPFIKTRSQAHRDFLRGKNPAAHIKATNKLQNTPWQINKQVLKVQNTVFKEQLGINIPTYIAKPLPDFPPHIAHLENKEWNTEQRKEVATWKGICKQIHTQNRINKGKVLAYKSIRDTANKYTQHTEFYFAYSTCFRGRLYCATTGLSPQGEDNAKGLLTFKKELPITTTGLFWLAIHGAGKFGYDKVSLNDRVIWIQNLTKQFKAVIANPIDTRTFWEQADKPWQFLAFIYEWAKTNYGTNPAALSSLPIALDGSCNGIQHYSALLRDHKGGKSVNLTNTALPQDIYQDVADQVIEKLKLINSPYAKVWLNASIDRTLAKKPVLTLPYGATRQSCKEYIYEWILDNRQAFPPTDQDLFKYSLFLTEILWNSMSTTVTAAISAMQWLQKATTEVLKNNPAAPITWTSPAGFPVYQGYMKTTSKLVSTALAGSTIARLRVTSQKPSTTDVNKFKQRLGITPNVVHSLDASHLVFTTNAANLTSLTMIHDDFGTHAANTAYLAYIIREQFIHMYKNHNPLQDWADQQPIEIQAKHPTLGTLNIDNVLNSTYFFS